MILRQWAKPAVWGKRTGSGWVEDGKASWMRLTLVHRAETFPGSEGNQVGGKPKQKLMVPHESFTSPSQLHCLTTLSCPQPSHYLTTLGSILLAFQQWSEHPYALQTREPVHSNSKGRWWGDWTSLGQSWMTNTSSERRQGDTVKSLPTRGIKLLFNTVCTENAHLQS